ncbi:MAG: ACP S-malonyltransferase [Planctomycetaceae bacterium]
MSRTGILFPGQGAQHVGMGKQLRAKYPAAARLFDQARESLGYDLAELCAEGPASELDATNVSQPAIFVASLAALEMLKAEHPEVLPQIEMAAGLSLGEYTALVFAGALSFEDGLRVVQQRGQAMQDAADATSSGMVSVLLLDVEQVRAIRDEASSVGIIELANYLCPGNTVLSGVTAACEKAVELTEAKGGRPIPLAVAGAFHTSIMKPADERLAKALEGVAIQPPRIPVVSNVDARPHSDPEEIRGLLVQQVLSPVRWEDSMRYMLDQGIESFYEVGPGKVLTGLMKRIHRKAPMTVINDSSPV